MAYGIGADCQRAVSARGPTREPERDPGARVDLAGDLIGEDENEGKALKAIYDKYSPTSYDSEVATEVGGMKSMLEAMFGVDLGDDEDLKAVVQIAISESVRVSA